MLLISYDFLFHSFQVIRKGLGLLSLSKREGSGSQSQRNFVSLASSLIILPTCHKSWFFEVKAWHFRVCWWDWRTCGEFQGKKTYRAGIMGAVCCCVREDYEDYLNPNSSVYRNCLCLRCFIQNFSHVVRFTALNAVYLLVFHLVLYLWHYLNHNLLVQHTQYPTLNNAGST